MKTFDMALSIGGPLSVTYVPLKDLGELDCAPDFYCDLSWYLIEYELVGFGVSKIVAPIGGKFVSRFEYAFLGGMCFTFGYAPELRKGVEWEPIHSTVEDFYREGFATLELTSK